MDKYENYSQMRKMIEQYFLLKRTWGEQGTDMDLTALGAGRGPGRGGDRGRPRRRSVAEPGVDGY